MSFLKACSFVPAATRMINDLQLQHLLHGVTFECPSPKPKVVRSHLEGNRYTSDEIDRIVRQSIQANKSLYYIDEPLLQSIAPDVIFTQDLCDVCQVGTNYAAPAIARLEKRPEVVALSPKNLDDVFDNILTVATALDFKENAYRLLSTLQSRISEITDTLHKNSVPPTRVMLIEWIEPIYNCGHWIPEMIALAGGVDMLGNPSGRSVVVEWDKIIRYDPEVIIVAPCGFEIERASDEATRLADMPGWQNLSAVKESQVYLADGNLFTCPGSQLVDAIELLAALFHPTLFKSPVQLSGCWARFQHKKAGI
jgi:iron complex transport system substrate-binding protein